MNFQEIYQIEFADCGENEHLKLSRMVDLMMQVSEHQLANSPAATTQMNQRGLGWVVTQYHFDIDYLPHPNEKVILETEASGYNRFFEYRDFMIKDQNDQVLVSAKSQWVMFDLKKRHLVPCDSDLMKSFEVPLLPKMPRFKRLRAQKAYENSRNYRVRYDDLDTNHHLTNSHYFNWFIDSLERDFINSHQPKAIDIKFNKEVKYGQVAQAKLAVKDEQDCIISYHALCDEEGKDYAVCEMIWEKERKL